MTHTVLLVEDEQELRETMREALELNGYTVVAASDGLEALDELDRIDDICLVLLDLVMPRMNGWEFFSQMRARAKFATVPVIVQSSSPLEPPTGVTCVLRKPFAFARLLSVVQEFCAGP